jgi:hypothetical protein
MAERALSSAPKAEDSEQAGEWVKFLQYCEKLRLLVLEKEECHAPEVENKTSTIEHYKWKNWSVFTGLAYRVGAMKKIEKLGPITPENSHHFGRFNRETTCFFKEVNLARERAIRDHEKQHRLVAEDKLIQARIKEEKAAEKALAKKRKRDK